MNFFLILKSIIFYSILQDSELSIKCKEEINKRTQFCKDLDEKFYMELLLDVATLQSYIIKHDFTNADIQNQLFKIWEIKSSNMLLGFVDLNEITYMKLLRKWKQKIQQSLAKIIKMIEKVISIIP